MGRARACRWAEFWFRSGLDKDTKKHRDLWDLCLWGRMSDQRSNVQKHNVQGVRFHPNTRTFMYMNDIYSKSLSHLHTRLQLSFTHAFPLQLPYMASSCSAWLGLPLGLFLSMLSSVRIDLYFQWQTGGVFLTAPDRLTIVDSRPWHGAFCSSSPCISLTDWLSSE